MAYASTTNVEALNEGRPPFGATSKPSATQVAEWLSQTAGVIDGILREQGYVVPVSPTAATSALETLANFNAAGAWYMVESGAKQSDRLAEAKAMWEWAQKMLQDGLVQLDLAIDTEESLPRSGFGSTSSAASAFFFREQEF